MPTVPVNGVEIYYEEAGSGTPLIFLHEFSGDYRSWEPQMRFFARRYRVVTMSYRGYPPSDIPADPAAYSQDILIDDILGLCDALGINRAHFCGLSIGGNSVVFLGLKHPERCLSLVAAAAGHGSVSDPTERAEFEDDFTSRADRLLAVGMEVVAEEQASKPNRIPMKVKDPRGWTEFRDQLLEHSAEGSAHTARGLNAKRPSFFDLKTELGRMVVPTLIIVGDQDQHCIEGSLFLKRILPCAGLHMFPMGGHLVNIEDPDLFNRTVLDFLTAAESGKWIKP
jgi:pimeloyl-ACP methyl ester carboxylesterase